VRDTAAETTRLPIPPPMRALGWAVAVGALLPALAWADGRTPPTPGPAHQQGVPARQPVASAEKRDVAVTRQMGFAIPFAVDAPPGAALPAEVRLYVSDDAGRTWTLHQRAKPSQRRFEFRAPAEGAYRFRIETVDARGRPHMPEGEAAELRVNVDATPPRVDLHAARGEAGEVTARWRIEEPNFRPKRMTLQYRSDGGPWQQVALEETNEDRQGVVHQGEVTWWPQPNQEPIDVRLEVIDAADNPAVARATAVVPRPDAKQSAAESPAVRQRPSQPPVVAQAVGSRVFELEYDPDGMAPQQLASVQLWGSSDGGHSWRLYSEDTDRRSPLMVRVAGDGRYGFRISVADGAGTSSPPPRPGDPPQIVIDVDTQPPVIESFTVRRLPDANRPSAHLTWHCRDRNLVTRGVTIAHSATPEGPWTPLVEGLPAAGETTIDLTRLPLAEVWFRLEATDRLGNRAEARGSQPVRGTVGPPRMQVRDLDPVGGGSQARGPRRYIFR